MVMINFLFGILIFKEPVADIWGTLGAFLLLIVGLVGMSIYSAPIPKDDTDNHRTNDVSTEGEDQVANRSDDESLQSPYQQFQDSQLRQRIAAVEPEVEMEAVPNDDDDSENPSSAAQPFVSSSTDDAELTPHIVLWNGRISLTQRQCGIIGAAMNGIMTGSSLLPVHYAEEEGFGGARYFPSMACGALLANICLWCLFFSVHAIKEFQDGNSIRQSIYSLPKLYFRELWLPGLLAGLLLSLAMFTSIISVTYLGQGVGNSLVQLKIMVSGMWGIFWYHEIVGTTRITKWFASAGVCVLAIIWLSLERLQAKAQANPHF
jgi:hypothetical protein